MSQVGRNLARFLADRDHQVEAESYFKQALEQARQAAHPELAGKALVAWGIFHTHQGRKTKHTPALMKQFHCFHKTIHTFALQMITLSPSIRELHARVLIPFKLQRDH